MLKTVEKWMTKRAKSDELEDDLTELIDEPLASKLNRLNYFGMAPLHVALSQGRTKSARKLIERGASVNLATTDEKNTPLHYAANSDNHRWSANFWTGVEVEQRRDTSVDFVGIAELLLDKGANPNLKNSQGNSSLHVAAISPDGLSMLRLLVKRGAHVDLRNNRGGTALSGAVEFRIDTSIRELLVCGANVRDESVVRVAKKFKGAARELREHWIKLYAADLPVFGDWDAKKVVASCESFYRRCSMEVETLKETFVDGNLSLYKWLHMCPNSRCDFVNGEQLKILVDSLDLEDRFPAYFVLILGTYREAVARQSLVQLAAIAWDPVGDSHTTIKHTFDQLTNADMLDLIANRKI